MPKVYYRKLGKFEKEMGAMKKEIKEKFGKINESILNEAVELREIYDHKSISFVYRMAMVDRMTNSPDCVHLV